MTAPLRARPPTGNVAWPLILVEGGEKVGKSYVSFALSASDKVGRTWVIDLGEGTADEYAALGPYEVLDHDGTYTDLYGQVLAATSVPRADDGKPNVIVIDSGTVLWESLRDWADARTRRSPKVRKVLQDDPDADIPIPMSIWNDAGERWGKVMHALRYWDGIAIIICRGKEVSKIGKDGNPVAGQTEYKVEAHKSLPAQVTAHVRCDSPKHARLMSVRSLNIEIPAKGLDLPEENPLEHVVFEVLGAGRTFGRSSAVAPRPEAVIPVEEADRIRELVNAGGQPARAAWLHQFDGVAPVDLSIDRLTEANEFAAAVVPLDQAPPPADDQAPTELWWVVDTEDALVGLDGPYDTREAAETAAQAYAARYDPDEGRTFEASNQASLPDDGPDGEPTGDDAFDGPPPSDELLTRYRETMNRAVKAGVQPALRKAALAEGFSFASPATMAAAIRVMAIAEELMDQADDDGSGYS